MNSTRGYKGFFATGRAGSELDAGRRNYRYIKKITELFGSVIFIYFVEFIYSATVFAGCSLQIG